MRGVVRGEKTSQEEWFFTLAAVGNLAFIRRAGGLDLA